MVKLKNEYDKKNDQDLAGWPKLNKIIRIEQNEEMKYEKKEKRWKKDYLVLKPETPLFKNKEFFLKEVL